MSTAQDIQLIDKLVKAKIPKDTATELIDRIEKNRSDTLERDVHWLKWFIILTMPLIIAIMLYLRNDTKTEIQSVRNEIQSVRGELKTEIQSVRNEVQSVKGELKAEIQSIRDDIKDLKNILLRR